MIKKKIVKKKTGKIKEKVATPIIKKKKNKKKITKSAAKEKIDENRTHNEIFMDKLSKEYNVLKIKTKELIKGLDVFYFNDIPAKKKIKSDSTGLVIYLDSPDMAVGKIKKVCDNVTIINIIDKNYEEITLLNEQIVLLDNETKLYKMYFKKFN